MWRQQEHTAQSTYIISILVLTAAADDGDDHDDHRQDATSTVHIVTGRHML